MTERKNFDSTRRALVFGGSAAVGTLASAAAGANALFDDNLPLREQVQKLEQDITALQDAEAIRHMQLAYTSLLQRQAYTELLELFTDDAVIEVSGRRYTGKHMGLKTLYTRDYPQQAVPDLHTAFRLGHDRRLDRVAVGRNGNTAAATLHCQVQISRPLTGGSAVEAMARLAGQHASCHWEQVTIAMDFRKTNGHWKIAGLTHLAPTQKV